MGRIAHAAHEMVIVGPGLASARGAVVRARTAGPDEQPSALDAPVRCTSYTLCTAF